MADKKRAVRKKQSEESKGPAAEHGEAGQVTPQEAADTDRQDGRSEREERAQKPTLTDLELVDALLAQFENNVTAKQLQPNISDFIRLLQYKSQLREEAPKEITVKWVEPAEENESPGQ